MQKVTWAQLFNYVSRRVNFRNERWQITWTCDGTLKAVKDFSDFHGLDFAEIQKKLQELVAIAIVQLCLIR